MNPPHDMFAMQISGEHVSASGHAQKLSRFPVRGFTLIEVLLVISMFGVMVTVLTWTISGNFARNKLDQGGLQFETMLRMVRAEATLSGRRFRVAFEPPQADGESTIPEGAQEIHIVVKWEPQPLAQPGDFINYIDAGWALSLPNELVVMQKAERTTSGSKRAEVFSAEGSEDDPSDLGDGEYKLQSIDFFPDGTSESAAFTLVARDPDDPRTVYITLDGMVGLISRRTFTPTEWDEHLDKLEEQEK